MSALGSVRTWVNVLGFGLLSTTLLGQTHESSRFSLLDATGGIRISATSAAFSLVGEFYSIRVGAVKLQSLGGQDLESPSLFPGDSIRVLVQLVNAGGPASFTVSLNIDTDQDWENGLLYDSHQTFPSEDKIVEVDGELWISWSVNLPSISEDAMLFFRVGVHDVEVYNKGYYFTDYLPLARAFTQPVGDWKRWGSFDGMELWTTYRPVIENQPLPAAALGTDFRMTGTVSGQPVGDVQRIQRAVIGFQRNRAIWSNLDYLEYWDVNGPFFDSRDLGTEVVEKTKFHTPAVDQAGNPESWNPVVFYNPNMVLNATNIGTIVVPKGTRDGSVNTLFIERLADAVSYTKPWAKNAQQRREIYGIVLAAAIMPERSDLALWHSSVRAQYQTEFDHALQTSGLHAAILSGASDKLEELTRFFTIYAFSVEAFEVANQVVTFEQFSTKLNVLAGLGKVVTPFLNGYDEWVDFLWYQIVARHAMSQIEMRLRLLDEVFQSSVWEVTFPGNLKGWMKDPAMLYGFRDAKDEILALLVALTSEDALERMFSELMWTASFEAFSEGMKLIVEEVTFAIVASLVTGGKYLIFKACYLAYDVGKIVQERLADEGRAVQAMFAAATVEQEIARLRPGNLHTTLGVKRAIGVAQIRRALAAYFYGTLTIRLDNEVGETLTNEIAQNYQYEMSRAFGSLARLTLDGFPLGSELPNSLALACMVISSPLEQAQEPMTAQLQITSSPASGGTTFGAGTYAVGTAIEIQAQANSGYRFARWEGQGTSSSSPVSILNLDTSVSLVAVFDRLWDLALAAYPDEGGSVVGGGQFVSGSRTRIEALASPGFVFDGWQGSGVVDPQSASTDVIVNGQRDVTARFVRQWIVSGQTSPAGSGVIIGGGAFGDRSIVELQLNPAYRYRFDRWEGATLLPSRPPAARLLVDRDLHMVAEMVRQGRIIVHADPPSWGEVAGGGWFDVGATAVLAATAYESAVFTDWSGPGISHSKTEVTQIEIQDSDAQSVVARFGMKGPSGFSTWSRENLASLPVDLAKPEADASRRGVSNLALFVAGFDLNQITQYRASHSLSLAQADEEIWLQRQIRLRENLPDGGVRVQFSSDMEQWETVSLSYSADSGWSAVPESYEIVEAQPVGDGVWSLLIRDSRQMGEFRTSRLIYIAD